MSDREQLLATYQDGYHTLTVYCRDLHNPADRATAKRMRKELARMREELMREHAVPEGDLPVP